MTRSKRFFLIGICLLLTLLATLPVSPAAAYNSFYSRAAIKNLRVRRAADQNLAAIDHLKLDQLVWVIEEAYDGNTRMYQIEYIDASGTRTTGWVPCTTGDTHYMKDLSDDEVAKLGYTTVGTLPTNVTSSSSSSGSSSSGSSSSSSTATYKGVYIKLGTKSSLVKEVQTALKKAKLYSGDITGTAGSKTVAAIKSFQKKKGLAADGVAGPATLAALLGGSSGSSDSSSGSSGGSSSGSSGDYGYTKVSKVNFRSGPSTSDASKALLATNTVFIVSDTKTVGNYTWYYVELVDGGTKGYIRGDMLSIMSASQLANYKAGQGITDGSSSSGSSSGATGLTSGMARITASNVNVRSGPGTTNKSNGKAARGDVFNITNSEAVGDGTWYKLSGKSTSLAGWVHGDYVHIMTDDEMDEYSKTNSGSSSSGSSSGTYRLLKYGSKGTDVSKLQQTLKDKGFYTGSVTGSYGTNTEAAVRAFQKKNGLYVDGIAGTNTQAMLYGDTSNASNVPTPDIKTVINMEWATFKSQISPQWPNGGAGVVTDVRTRKSFNIVKQSAGNHLDVEPATSNDTAIMKQIYGGSITYQRRPVWVTIGVASAGGYQTYAGSMYGVAHGADTVPGNNFDGQFCIHLLNSTNHVAGAVDKEHQAAVNEAATTKP